MSTYCHECGAEYGHVENCMEGLKDELHEEQLRNKEHALKPLWQMDIRHRLNLAPDRTDAVGRLLFAALYAARDEQEFVIMLENHQSELQKTLNTLRE